MSEMSTHTRQTAYEQQVLEAALYEGPFSALISDGEALTEMLRTTDMSMEETQLLLDDLNSRAEQYIGARATLHGRAIFAEVSIPEKTAEDGDDDSKSSDTLYAAKGDPKQSVVGIGEKRYFEELVITFDGFRIIEEPIMIDDELVAYDRKAAMAVTRLATSDEMALRPEIQALTGLAQIHESHLVFTGMSVEHARMWLAHFAPDIIDDIDSIILNASTSREAFLKLKDMSFASPQEGFASEFEVALDVYLDSIMDIDVVAPYMMALSEGEVIMENSDGSHVIGMVSSATYLCNVKRVMTWKTALDDQGTFALTPHVRVAVLKADHASPPVELIVPSCRIEDIISSRAQFYGTE